jgi:hypothetical protein
METRKIGMWTEQVPPAALNKRRQEIASNPSLGGGEEVEEAEEEGVEDREREDEDGGVIDPHSEEGEVAEEAEEVEEEGDGWVLDQEEAVVDGEEMMTTEADTRRSEGRDGNRTRMVARVMD